MFPIILVLGLACLKPLPAPGTRGYPLHEKDQFVPTDPAKSGMLPTGKQPGREPARLKPLVIHHIAPTFPMQQFHDFTRLADKDIDHAVGRIASGLPDLAAHGVDTNPHVCGSVGEEELVAFVEIEHNAVNFRQRSEVYSLWERRLKLNGYEKEATANVSQSWLKQ